MSSRISWTAYEFEYKHKSIVWYFVLGIIATGLSLWAFARGSFVEMILYIFGGLSTFLFAIRRPQKRKYSLTSKGLKIDKELYSYQNMDSFWIHYEPDERQELVVRLTHSMIQTISAPLSNQDPVEVRKYLLAFIPEKVEEDSPLDMIARRLGF